MDAIQLCRLHCRRHRRRRHQHRRHEFEAYRAVRTTKQKPNVSCSKSTATEQKEVNMLLRQMKSEKDLRTATL